MPSFDKEFHEAKGTPIKYKNWKLIRIGRIPVQKKFSGSLKLISTNSEYKQAIVVSADDKKKKIIIDSQEGHRFIIWEDEIADSDIHFEGTSKNLQLFVYNAWEEFDHRGTPNTNYWYYGAAMIEEIINGNTRRYRCNDGHPDDNFDDIIFEVTINEEPITDKK